MQDLGSEEAPLAQQHVKSITHFLGYEDIEVISGTGGWREGNLLSDFVQIYLKIDYTPSFIS